MSKNHNNDVNMANAEIVGATQRESARQHVVIEYSGYYAMPPHFRLEQLPGGFYYPARERGSDLFGLKKVNIGDSQHYDFGLSENSKSAMFDRHRKITFDEIDVQMAEVATRTQRERYFPMENYHPELKSAKENITCFVENEAFYRSRGLNFKRSVLLFGEPGTGKSRFLYETCLDLIRSHEAIVIKIDSDSDLDCFFDHGMVPMSQQLQGRFKVLLIEELSQLCRGSHDLVKLLHLLDSFVLNDNLLFLMSTNYPERIPSNVIDRPSRVDHITCINSDGFTADMIPAWFAHLMGRPLTEDEKNSEWMRAQLSPAYLKELFTHAQINDVSLQESWNLIKKRRAMIGRNFATAERRVGFQSGKRMPRPLPVKLGR